MTCDCEWFVDESERLDKYCAVCNHHLACHDLCMGRHTCYFPGVRVKTLSDIVNDRVIEESKNQISKMFSQYYSMECHNNG